MADMDELRDCRCETCEPDNPVHELRKKLSQRDAVIEKCEKALKLQAEWFGLNSSGVAGPDVEKKAIEALLQIREARRP